MGIGSITFSFPHFLMGPYDLGDGDGNSTSSNICSRYYKGHQNFWSYSNSRNQILMLFVMTVIWTLIFFIFFPGEIFTLHPSARHPKPRIYWRKSPDSRSSNPWLKVSQFKSIKYLGLKSQEIETSQIKCQLLWTGLWKSRAVIPHNKQFHSLPHWLLFWILL